MPYRNPAGGLARLTAVRRLLEQLNENMATIARELERTNRYSQPMTRDEAAAYLQVNADTLYRWSVREGRITYSRLGDGGRAALRYRREDLDDFIRKSRIPTVEEAGRTVTKL